MDDLKLALGIDDDTDDEALQAAITFQSRIIAEYCDRRLAFAEAMETFTFDRNETMLTRQALTLSLYPVAQIFEVSTAGATAADYDFDPASGRLWTEGFWSDVIAVTYSRRLRSARRGTGAAAEGGDPGGERGPHIRRPRSHHPRGAARRYPRQLFHADAGGRLLGLPVGAVVDLIKPYRQLHVA